jgi:hypothetical protein
MEEATDWEKVFKGLKEDGGRIQAHLDRAYLERSKGFARQDSPEDRQIIYSRWEKKRRVLNGRNQEEM